MPNHLEGDIISPAEPTIGGVIRSERVWTHRYDIEVKMQKPRRNLRSLLVVGAGGVMLSTAIVFGYGDLESTHKQVFTETVASTTVREEAAKNLRDVLASATARASVSPADTQIASFAYTVTPTRCPHFQTGKPSGSLKSIDASSAMNAADTVHFDKCVPGCETRDPLIVGAVHETSPVLVPEGLAELPAPHSSSPALEVGQAALKGAGFVLVQTAALPFTTVKFGHDAVMAVAQPD